MEVSAPTEEARFPQLGAGSSWAALPRTREPIEWPFVY